MYQSRLSAKLYALSVGMYEVQVVT
jgi:hypothetical protein